MMGSRREMMGVVFALLAFFLPIVTAQGTTSNITAASTFYFDRTETQFSVNIADDSDDVFIYFASPAYSWVGVGFGPKMQGSLMFIMYPNSKGNNVTVSPRIGSSGAEPTFNSSIDLSILPGTTVNDSMLILKARCGNCRDYMDMEAESQPMIYAFGNGDNLMSNSPSANLARHFGYGSFTMNLRAANGPGGVPAKSNARNGVEMQGEMTRDHDRANLAHAIMGCLALFILWPLNLIAVAVFKNIKIHVMFSAIILVFLIVSFVLGGVVSGQYNRSKAFNTPHQIFALVAILPLLLMSLLPALNHINARLRSLHTPLASTSFALLVLTGGLGLHLSSQTRSIILVYTALSLGIFMFLILMHTCIHRRGSAHARALNRGSNDDAIMLAKMDDCRSIPSAAGFGNQPPPPYPPPYGSAEVAGAQHQRNGSRSMYGGGTMPGPHYMLNMHPGVPVQVSRM